MASYPAPPNASLSIFNTSNIEVIYDSDTIDYADSRYVFDSSGNASGLTVTNGLSVSGGISISGNISSSNGSVTSYQNFKTSQSGWGLGPSSILDSSGISYSSYVGSYIINSGWTSTTSSSHTISLSSFAISSTNTNIMASFRIYVSDKASASARLGIITAEYLYQNGSTAQIFTISTTKTSTLSTFSVSITGTSSILVSCDSACKMCFHAVVTI